LGISDITKVRLHFGMAVLLVGFGAMSARADVLYNDIPAGTATGSAPDFNYSMPFFEDQVSEFGGLISMNTGAFPNAALTGGSVALSNWAQEANYGAYIAANNLTGTIGVDATGANSLGYAANVTVNVYGVGSSLGVDPGSGDTLYSVAPLLLGTSTTNVFIDWRPAATPGDPSALACTDGSSSFINGSTEQCGAVNLVNFNLSAVVPSTVIYTISINTGTDGSGNPLPTDSLNLGMNSEPAQSFGVGSSDPDTAYYSALASSALNPLSGGGSLAADVGWSSFGYGAVEFDGTGAVPEPATFGLIGFGLVGLGVIARKKRKNKV
jgi:hypothetical protein